MAGEFKIAQQHINAALETSRAQATMSEEAMLLALFNELVGRLAKTNSTRHLQDMLHFQLQAQSEDEHVITRGC